VVERYSTQPVNSPPVGRAAGVTPIRILFNVWADAENYNAQSLNAREIALRLDSARFCSTVFCQGVPDPRLGPAGVRIVRLAGRRLTFGLLREMLKAYHFVFYIDISPASYLYLHVPLYLRRGCRSVLCVEGTRGNLDGLSPAVMRKADYVLRHADIRTAISDYVARDLFDASGVKVDFTIPVGVDTKLFVPPLQGERNPPTVLFVGHLLQRKGAELVLEIAKRLPRTQFRLIGAARDEFGRALLQQYERETPANVRIERPGPQTQLASAMRECGLLLLPSRVEGIPKVTLEAAASGLPAVVFSDYRTPSVVDGVTGYQVSTLEEMVERVRRLVDDASLRQKMGAAAVAHAQQYDWDCVAAQWSSALERIAGQAGR
jgi:glycosyltransferase involved in cell wall biosynthesis